MKRKKQQEYQVTNHLMDGTINHDMTGVIIPDGHVFYDVEHLLHNKQAKGA
ncbi:BOW99_gp33 family protein [Streptococcus pluranimalium]|uniref:BOW99_gp33 family protein n=1 Tax=Streptococcus pluranimalium TaxID=82348 RepID=UPI0039FD79D8